jgi:hypothetical protein
MTNLDIIKYLATNNPTRLAELLEDIYCTAWNDGANDKLGDESAIPNFDKWIYEDAAKSGFHYHYELEQWSKATNPIPTIEATYDNLTVTIPVGDPDYMWNKNNEYDYKMETIETAIDELKLVETLVKSEEIPDVVYDRFRTEECVRCDEPNCMASDMEICDCHKFKGYYEV